MTNFLTLPEAAERRDVSVSTVRNRIAAGLLQAHHLPGTNRFLVRADEVAILLEPTPVTT